MALYVTSFHCLLADMLTVRQALQNQLCCAAQQEQESLKRSFHSLCDGCARVCLALQPKQKTQGQTGERAATVAPDVSLFTQTNEIMQQADRRPHSGFINPNQGPGLNIVCCITGSPATHPRHARFPSSLRQIPTRLLQLPPHSSRCHRVSGRRRGDCNCAGEEAGPVHPVQKHSQAASGAGLCVCGEAAARRGVQAES